MKMLNHLGAGDPTATKTSVKFSDLFLYLVFVGSIGCLFRISMALKFCYHANLISAFRMRGIDQGMIFFPFKNKRIKKSQYLIHNCSFILGKSNIT